MKQGTKVWLFSQLPQEEDKMKVQDLTYSEKVPQTEKFMGLFLTTGWNDSYQLNKAEMKKALENSWYTYSVYDEKKLIGFGRIICDGIVHALILDLIIIPEYQGQGIGKTILTRLVNQCKKHRVRDIQLFSAKNKADFYKKSGFTLRPELSPGMELKWFRKD